MKILMTGATGYIGSHLARKLACEGHRLYCVARPSSDTGKLKEWAEKIIIIEDNAQLYECLPEIMPDIVIHLAGVFLREHSPGDVGRLMESNIVFSAFLLDAADRAGCKYLINTGSYWQSYQKAQYNPVNLYAATKQAYEDIVRYYTAGRGWRALTLRLFDVFGPDDPRRKVLNLVHWLPEGERMGMSPGDQKMYMCYIDDVVRAYLRAMEIVTGLEPGSDLRYAVRAEKPVTLKKIMDTYLKLSGRNITLNWGERDYGSREIMDPEGIGTVLEGWTPEYGLEEALKRYIAGWSNE